MEKIDYRQYEVLIKTLREGIAKWERISTTTNYDKKGFGFNRDSRFSSITINLSLDSWAGTYGNSSCSTIINVPNHELFEKAFITVLNKEFFSSLNKVIAELEREAETAKLEEIGQLKSRLQELEK